MKIYLTLLLFTISSINIFSQTIDDEFGALIKAGIKDNSVKVAAQENQVIVGGNVNTVGNTAVNRVFRLNEDGSLDNSFNIDIDIVGRVNDILVQDDNKILIIGQALSEYGNVIRLNEDGSRDTSFELADNFKEIDAVKIRRQSDGKYILASFSFFYNSALQNLFRFNSDGSIDDSFLANAGMSGVDLVYFDMQIDADDRIIASSTLYNNEAVGGLIRFNADGSLDETFNISQGFERSGGNPLITQIEILADNSLLIAGDYDSFDGNPSANVTKLSATGAYDATFNISSTISYSFSYLDQASTDNVLVGGFTNDGADYVYKIMRLNADGSKDDTFNEINYLSSENGSPKSISVANRNIITLGAITSTLNNEVFGLGLADASGTLSTTTPLVAGIGTVNAMKKDANGGLIIGGKFSLVDEFRVNNIVRLNPDGTVDQNFLQNIGTGFDRLVSSLVLQQDGSLLIGGGFSNLDGQPVSGLVRLSDEGVLDGSFNAEVARTSVNDGVTSIALLDDGILVGGSGIANYTNAEPLYNFLKLNNDGSLDQGFNQGGVINSDMELKALKIQSDNKILVGGNNKSTDSGFLLRLNSDGTVDDTFTHSLDLSNRQITAIEITETEEIVLGNEFSSSFSNNNKAICVLNMDGTSSRNEELQVTDWGNVTNIIPLREDTVLLAGDFTEINNIERNGIVLADLSGNILDYDFGIETNGIDNNESVNSIFVSDNSTYIGGRFARINGESIVSSFVKISNCSPSGSEDVDACDSYEWEGTVLTASGSYEKLYTNALGCDSLATLNLTILQSSEGSEDVTVCDSFEWEGMTYTESGVYETTLVNVSGCDSLATLNLTILLSSEGSEDVQACESFEWEGMTYTESGVYETILTNIAGCDSTATLNLEILSIPEIEIGFSEKAMVHIPKENEATDSYEYQWFNCEGDDPIEGATSNTFETDEPGTYYLQISNGICVEESACLSNEIVLSSKTEHAFKLYPNPFNNQLFVEFDGSLNNVTLEILNIDGAKCISKQVKANTTDISVGLEQLETGLYTLLIKQNNQVIGSRKIVKE